MVKRGARVVAIDKGVLEYEKLATKDVKVIEDLKDYSEGNAVLHIRMNLSGTEELPFKRSGFDLLAIDINTDYLESSKVANFLAAYLKSTATAIRSAARSPSLPPASTPQTAW